MLTGKVSEDDPNDKEMHDAMNYEFDAWTKLRIQELVTERAQGRYKGNDAEFTKAFMNISQNCGYDYSQKVV